jgi:hypothetical protein
MWARFVLMPRAMRTQTSHLVVSPVPDMLFPQREFPPYLALDRVRRCIDSVLARQCTQPPDLDRLQARVSAIAQRLVSLAHGQLRLFRWYRRIAVSVQMCQRARLSLPDYVRIGAMSDAEAAAIDRGLGDVVERLRDELTRPELPTEARPHLPSTDSTLEPSP